MNIEFGTDRTCHRCGDETKYNIWWDMEYCPGCTPMQLEMDVGGELA